VKGGKGRKGQNIWVLTPIYEQENFPSEF
jgi:hypothetical protein